MEKYNGAGQTTDDSIIWRMRFACWINKATDTLRVCNAYGFPQQKCLSERASVLF